MNNKLRDQLAEQQTAFCRCAGPTCSGCESKTKDMFCRGWDTCNAHWESQVNDARVELAAIIDNPDQEITADEVPEELTYEDRRCIAQAFNLLMTYKQKLESKS